MHSVGQSEFQIERVSLLHRKTQRGYQGCIGDIDFVMIGKQKEAEKTLPNDAEDETIFMTAVMGNLNVDEINMIQDYIS